VTLRYEKQVFVQRDIRTVTVAGSSGERESLGLQVYYNKVFLKFAEPLIRAEMALLRPKESRQDDQAGQKPEGDTLANKLLDKMQLNSPLKETLPNFMPEKIKSHSLSNFSYLPRSPFGGDALISRSPDGMRRVLGVNQAA
jgi:hypothetical protein